MEKQSIGSICWTDLTVPNAEEVKTFYEAVVGLKSTPHDMEADYHDFNMNLPDTGETVTGICHARGVNADVPPQWLVYFLVEDIEASVAKCKELGGEIVAGPRLMGTGGFCVVRDPAGAVCALFNPAGLG
jgi:uncharacterized protein